MTVCVNRESKTQIYVEKVEWNGNAINGYKISVSSLMQGGKLEFFMK